MHSSIRWLRAHSWGLTVGATATLAVLVAFNGGHLERYSASTLDFKFKHFNRVEADTRIVMIDITDYAVESVHKWPWPRELHAWLIGALDELGARAVLMDIIFDAPEAGRIDDPRLEADALFEAPQQVLGDLDIRNAQWGDKLFQEALRKAGNVYLGMFASRSYHPSYFPDNVRRMTYEVLDEQPEISLQRFESEMRRRMPANLDWVPESTGRGAEQSDRNELFELVRIEKQLEADFSLDELQLESMLNLGGDRVMRHFAVAKRSVARRLVSRFREERPDATWADTFAHILPGRSIDIVSADRKDLRQAFRSATSERNVMRGAIDVHESLIGKLRNIADMTYPLDFLTEVASAGLVVFEADAADGVMRRVPLVVNDRGKLIKHLGFALAADVLGIDERSIRLEEGNVLTMRTHSGDRSWRVQLDDQGWSLTNWHTDRKHAGLWTWSFKHIPVSLPMGIPLNRDRIDKAEGRAAYLRKEYVEAAADPNSGTVNRYIGAVNRRLELRWEGSTPAAEMARLEEEIRAIEERSVNAIEEWGAQMTEALDDGASESDFEEDERHILHLSRRIDELRAMNDETEAFVSARQAEIERLLRKLKPQIAGNICLVGYTATAVADTVNTPVGDEVPGVMAHANLVNSLLVNQFPGSVRPIGAWYTWFDVLLILLTGAIVTAITVWRDPWFSLVTMLLVTGVLFVSSFSLFFIDSFHIDIVGPFLSGFLSWVFVTLYRQFTEERQKRAFSQSLGQYTSPAIAAKLAETLTNKSGSVDLAPIACQVTCFFSDLKGFTSISERLGAARTRDVLNPYLEAMSEVLIRHDAMINKFMGDGIFAFFNPPILPVTRHAAAACEATIDSFVALDELKVWLAKGEIADEVNDLSMRVGINTGEVFVGDYGSSNKLDYTCIGDTVNLSARLEPACKPFGIQAMMSEATLTEAGDAYVVRHLGGLQVVGKKLAVQVYELIGRKGEVDSGRVEYAEIYGEAVKRFQIRDWDAALRHLAECRKAQTEDKAVDLLEKNIRAHQQTPPPDDWNQAIELTSK